MAVVIALRNLYFVSTQLSFEFYLDNYTNGDITNEKFVIAMLIIGGFLLYWGRFRKKENDDDDDYYDDARRRRPPSSP
jgi:LPXTG-motif cell wall-anchored protein